MEIKSEEIQLDLAFTPISSDYFLENPTNSYLNHSQYWRECLRVWIYLAKNLVHEKIPRACIASKKFSLGLQFTDDLTISELNQQWLGKPEPTDVLSFPVIDDKIHMLSFPQESLELGDIVVSIQTAHKQAISLEHTLENELCWLITHGLLHLLGWDHPNSQMLDQMLNFQGKLINASKNYSNLSEFEVNQ